VEEASKIALITGFGGVVVGGIITFSTEWLFRRQDRKERSKKNFTLCLCEVGRVYSELVSLYRVLTAELPDTAPELLAPNIRSMASSTIQPSNLDTVVLFSANHRDDEIFSDLELLFRRFNSLIDTFVRTNEFREAMTERHLQAGLIVPLGKQDIAEQTIELDDVQSVIEIVRIENLYRGFFQSLVADIEDCCVILDRLNLISEKKYGYFRWQTPPTVELAMQFEPLEYLREMPPIGPDDIPRHER
jgi:hypothetical protein